MPDSVDAGKRLLLLFSSNIRPRYQQDILNVLAAPVGLRFQFRYRSGYLNDAARDGWIDGSLRGSKSLIHFSLQQEARFHNPVLIPIRLATSVETRKEGDVFLIDFAVAGHAALLRPPSATPERPAPFNYAEPVQKYQAYLDSRKVDRPYDYWACLVEDFTSDTNCPLDISSDTVTLFQRTTQYLHQTSPYRSAKYFLVQGIRAPDGKTADVTDGNFQLKGGETYDLLVFHNQPEQGPNVSTFQVSANKDVLVVGRQSFDIASEYASIRLPMSAIVQPQNQRGLTDLTIDASQDVQGPRLQMPVQVDPPAGRRAQAGAIAGLALLLAGLSSVVGLPLKAFFIGAGALVAGVGAFGLSRRDLAGILARNPK